jgi:hypothetical protein
MDGDDVLDKIEEEIEEICEDENNETCDRLEEVVEDVRGTSDDPLTYTDFTSNPHSYRHYTTEMVERLIATVGTERFEKGVEASARDGIDYIEDGRWSPFLEEASQMFNRLDDDERDLFTQRNPGVVEWITVFDEANGYDPMERRRSDARSELSEDGARDPPKYARDRGSAPPNDDLVQSMVQRRRSYRNWTPQEFQDVLSMEEVRLSVGRAGEIGFRSAEIRDTMREEGAFPIDADSKEVSRELLGRVEAGRFEPMLSELMTFFSRLDPDERRMFSRRNPGLIMWLSVYGESNHLIHREQLKAHTYPTLREM